MANVAEEIGGSEVIKKTAGRSIPLIIKQGSILSSVVVAIA